MKARDSAAGRGSSLRRALEAVLPAERVHDRLIDRIARASDASFYRLVPEVVVEPATVTEVQGLFRVGQALGLPLVFRASGTSLSGQAITDGILVDVTRHWNDLEVEAEGARVRVGPGVIGAHVNARLAQFGRRIGPDPASIDSCRVGGILANNSSGMCCGVAENSYHTVESLRFVLPSGVYVDSASPDAEERFASEAPEIARGLLALRERIHNDAELVARMRAKYRQKNTTGYSLNAFIDESSPVRMLARLMIGSEGTLAFIADATFGTLPAYPYRRTGLLLFEDLEQAGRAVPHAARSGARAVEILDRASLDASRGQPGLPVDPFDLPAAAAALLVEYQCDTGDALADARRASAALERELDFAVRPRFTEEATEQAALWKIRKGLFPAVGATKASGETAIIEDVVFPVERLSAGIGDLRRLFDAHGYGDAIVFGHAKEGNCHFVLKQTFNDDAEIARYERFIGELVELVLNRYDGALKAEHGTGRNMAPFVEAEWGREATAVMRELKELVDPDGLLNPGVIINSDPRAHLLHLKQLPAIEVEADSCIECGYCEHVCPSRRLTTTPRQRIVLRREMVRLEAQGELDALAELAGDFAYDVEATCAADGLCATVCPVAINTGELVKRLRGERIGARGADRALRLARHFGTLETVLAAGVELGHVAADTLGAGALLGPTRLVERVLGRSLPKWLADMPHTPSRLPPTDPDAPADVVYLDSCLSRLMGKPPTGEASLGETLRAVAARAGVRLRCPPTQGHCCGLPFGSKGYHAAHAELAGSLVDALWNWSEQGKLPVVVDASSCLYALMTSAELLSAGARGRFDELRLLDVVELLDSSILPRLDVRRLDRRVALHPTCATRKLGLEQSLGDVARRCATQVAIPDALDCCAMAGDRGLIYPELSASALEGEVAELSEGSYDAWYSTNLTCELALGRATGAPYRNILYLVEEASRPQT